MIKRYCYILFIIIFSIVNIVGCSNSADEYKHFTSEYYETYFSIANSVDIKHTQDTLQDLQSKANIQSMRKLKELLEGIKNKVPEGKTQGYERLRKWYKNLEELQIAYENWNTMTPEEKSNILMQLREIDRRRINWNNPNSNIVWE